MHPYVFSLGMAALITAGLFVAVVNLITSYRAWARNNSNTEGTTK